MLELALCEYAERRENLLLVDGPGTGKTHLATALGVEACDRGKRVRFFRASELVTQLMEAREERQLMHLFGHELVPRWPAQVDLFEGPRGRAEALARLKREVNAEHGRFALRSAATLPLPGIYRDPSNEWDICECGGRCASDRGRGRPKRVVGARS